MSGPSPASVYGTLAIRLSGSSSARLRGFLRPRAAISRPPGFRARGDVGHPLLHVVALRRPGRRDFAASPWPCGAAGVLRSARCDAFTCTALEARGLPSPDQADGDPPGLFRLARVHGRAELVLRFPRRRPGPVRSRLAPARGAQPLSLGQPDPLLKRCSTLTHAPAVLSRSPRSRRDRSWPLTPANSEPSVTPGARRAFALARSSACRCGRGRSRPFVRRPFVVVRKISAPGTAPAQRGPPARALLRSPAYPCNVEGWLRSVTAITRDVAGGDETPEPSPRSSAIIPCGAPFEHHT